MCVCRAIPGVCYRHHRPGISACCRPHYYFLRLQVCYRVTQNTFMSVPTRINTRHKTPSCPFQHASTRYKTSQAHKSEYNANHFTEHVNSNHIAPSRQSQSAFTPITKPVHANHKARSCQSQSLFTPITTRISRIHNTREHSTDINTTRRARQCHVQTVLTDCLHDNRWNFQRLGSQNATCFNPSSFACALKWKLSSVTVKKYFFTRLHLVSTH